MRVFIVQETIKGKEGVANVTNRGTFLKYEDARQLFVKLVMFGELKDPLFNQAIDHGGFATYSNDRASWGTRDGELHQFDIIESIIDVPTVYEECESISLTTEDVQRPYFESRFEHELNNTIIESIDKSVKGDESLQNILYNSGEFTIVFQCDDLSRSVATCLPYEAESCDQIIEAIRTFIKNCY